MMATNLHADTYEEARDQVVGQNHVPAEAFRRMHLALFLHVRGGWRGPREIVAAWESDGKQDHRRVYAKGKLDAKGSPWAKPERIRQARDRLDRVLASGARSIDEVRSQLIKD
jgi:hypothetical protein